MRFNGIPNSFRIQVIEWWNARAEGDQRPHVTRQVTFSIISTQVVISGRAGPAIFASALLLVAPFVTGCDPTFEPMEENDRHVFSLYGYLDASADTQWVRVTPVRESVAVIPDEIDATVTVEHLSSGETALMHDSLRRFFHDVHAYNFWTTMELHPEATYRLKMVTSDGKSSDATVTLPEDFPTPRIRLADPDTDDPDIVLIEGVERLADVQVLYHVRDASGNESVISVPHAHDALHRESAAYDVVIDPDDVQDYFERYYPGGIGELVDKEVFVASAGPDWQSFDSIDEIIATLPNALSNVENGVGFLAGVLSITIPYRSCFDAEGDLVACPVAE